MLFDELVVVLGDIFHNLVAVFVVKLLVDRGGLQGRGHIRPRIHKRLVPKLCYFEDFKFRAQRFFQPDNYFFLEEIDDPDEIIFAAEGELQGNGVGSKTLSNGADDVVEIRAHAVHLVHETDARDTVLVCLAPHGLRLGLHAGDGVEHAHRAVQNAQRALHFHGEVHVARCINNIDAIFLPKAVPGRRRRRACNRDPALALLLHPVHAGRAFIHRTHLVAHTLVEEHPLRRPRLTGVDVRHDPDVAGIFEFECSAHSSWNSFLFSCSRCDCFTHRNHLPFTSALFTSDSARTPCSLPPCGLRLPSSSSLRRAHSLRQSTHPRACPPSFCPRVPANTAAASESPVIACGTDSLPPEPGSSRRQRDASSLPAAPSRSRWPS